MQTTNNAEPPFPEGEQKKFPKHRVEMGYGEDNCAILFLIEIATDCTTMTAHTLIGQKEYVSLDQDKRKKYILRQIEAADFLLEAKS